MVDSEENYKFDLGVKGLTDARKNIKQTPSKIPSKSKRCLFLTGSKTIQDVKQCKG